MDARLPRTARLRTPLEFRRALSDADAFPGRECLVRRTPNDVGLARIGIAAPRRYGSAVRRNRFRRLVREAFRHLREELAGYDYLISPKRSLVEPTLEGIRHDLARTRTRPPAPRRPARSGRPRR